MNVKKAKQFDAKARQTKILNRLTELTQDERTRIDNQVKDRAMLQFTYNKKRTRNYSFFLLGICMTLFMAWLFGAFNRPVQKVTPIQYRPAPTVVLTATPTPTVAPLKTRTQTSNRVWVGKVSHYSRAGCLGCSPTLTMANGQPLDDNAMTIAFNWLPLNTQVRVTNLDNGKSVIATVTDTGGFNSLNRIADLVPAVANELGTKTDVTNVLIEAL